jgi:hypothetical protein
MLTRCPCATLERPSKANPSPAPTQTTASSSCFGREGMIIGGMRMPLASRFQGTIAVQVLHCQLQRDGFPPCDFQPGCKLRPNRSNPSQVLPNRAHRIRSRPESGSSRGVQRMANPLLTGGGAKHGDFRADILSMPVP